MPSTACALARLVCQIPRAAAIMYSKEPGTACDFSGTSWHATKALEVTMRMLLYDDHDLKGELERLASETKDPSDDPRKIAGVWTVGLAAMFGLVARQEKIEGFAGKSYTHEMRTTTLTLHTRQVQQVCYAPSCQRCDVGIGRRETALPQSRPRALRAIRSHVPSSEDE